MNAVTMGGWFKNVSKTQKKCPILRTFFPPGIKVHLYAVVLSMGRISAAIFDFLLEAFSILTRV